MTTRADHPAATAAQARANQNDSPRGGSRAVKRYLDRLENLIATSNPHELAQLGYGLARVLDARARRVGAINNESPLFEGMSLADVADEAIANASPQQLTDLRHAISAIVHPAQQAFLRKRKPPGPRTPPLQ